MVLCGFCKTADTERISQVELARDAVSIDALSFEKIREYRSQRAWM